MPLFRRKQTTPDQAAAIAAFWAWWGETGAAWVAQAIADRDPQRVVDELSSRIGAVRDGLAWELAPGGSTEHLLVVSADGNPDLRASARRWLRAAPPPSAVWRYADSRQPVADLGDALLDVNGTEVTLGDLTVLVEPQDTRLAVTVHHPTFAAIPERDRTFISFLALDNAIGEAAVETWISGVEPSPTASPGAVPLEQLRSLLAAHVGQHLDDEGQPTWRILSAETSAGPMLVTAMVPLAPSVAADLDQHVAVVVPYVHRNEGEFPTEVSLDALRALEDHLCERVGTGGRLVAHETCAGRRTLHFYVDSTGPAADVLRTAVAGWQEGRVEVSAEPDPGWEAVRHFG